MDDLKERFKIFEGSPAFRWSKLNIEENKPRKPSRVKSKRVLSTKPEHIKTHRT